MSNWLYSNSTNNKERFLLGETGDNPLVCIGVNPSTAEPDQLDNTIRLLKTKTLTVVMYDYSQNNT